MVWSEYIRIIWPILTGITPIILIGGFAWLQTKFITKAEHDKYEALVKREQDAHQEAMAKLELRIEWVRERQIFNEGRIDQNAKELSSEPSKSELVNAISGLRERIGSLESGFRMIAGQLDTQNGYLQTLVEHRMSK